jgi:ribosomal protein S13
LFFGGRLFYTNRSLRNVFLHIFGLGKLFSLLIFSRLELNFSIKVFASNLNNFKHAFKREIIHFFNSLFSQINSVNNIYSELKQLNIVRLYLVRTSRGICHAIGKPVRGQRTWSNGWSAYKYNKLLRQFISEMRLKNTQNTGSDKINYKLIKKKYATTKKHKTRSSVKKYIWF